MYFKTGEHKWDEIKGGRSIDRITFPSFFALVPYTRKSSNPFQKGVVRDDPNQHSFQLCFTLTLWLISITNSKIKVSSEEIAGTFPLTWFLVILTHCLQLI